MQNLHIACLDPVEDLEGTFFPDACHRSDGRGGRGIHYDISLLLEASRRHGVPPHRDTSFPGHDNHESGEYQVMETVAGIVHQKTSLDGDAQIVLDLETHRGYLCYGRVSWPHREKLACCGNDEPGL